jgi:hypothetical protein
VGADVLGVAVQEQNRAVRLALGRQKPGVQACAVARRKIHVFVFQPQLLGRKHLVAIGKEKHPIAAQKAGSQHDDEQQTPHQK